MGWYQEAVRSQFQNYFKQVTGIKPEDRSAVRLDVAETGKAGTDPGGRVKIRNKKNIMNFSHPALLFIN